jgi:hypothetical protein
MTREAGWGAVKAVLKGFSATALLALVHDLDEVSPENRQFLLGRLLPSDTDLSRSTGRPEASGQPRPAQQR